jgi:hypothetical protein
MILLLLYALGFQKYAYANITKYGISVKISKHLTIGSPLLSFKLFISNCSGGDDIILTSRMNVNLDGFVPKNSET